MFEFSFYLSSVCVLLCLSHANGGKTGPFFNGKLQNGNRNLHLQSDIKEIWTESPWISNEIKLGEVSGISIDPNDIIYLFHRVDRVWDYKTFTDDNIYTMKNSGPIKEPTILTFNSDGKLLSSLAENMFYFPHGITVDSEFNIWTTDVALHQVFKLSPNASSVILELGEKLTPGSDSKHFCKPTSVAVVSNGDFFVADGYCNSRIIKFNSDGVKILQWGRETTNDFYRPGHYQMAVPHALTVAEEKGLLCTADRENGRVLCFKIEDGTYVTEFTSPAMGTRVFSVSYSPKGKQFFAVNGQSSSPLIPVQGFVFNLEGKLVGRFGSQLKTPHDIAVSRDGNTVYVAELLPSRAWKFVSNNHDMVDSEITEDTDIVPSGQRLPDDNKKPDEVEGLTGAVLVTIGCFIFAFGIFVAIAFYSKSRKSSNPDTKRLLSNVDY